MVLTRPVTRALPAPALGALMLCLVLAEARAQQPSAPARAPRPATTPRATPAPARTAPPASAAATAPAAASASADDEAAAELGATLAGRRQQRRTAWLGIGLSCSRCSFHTEGKSLSAWVFSEPPVLYQVEPNSPADRGGLRSGDSLLSVNGQALTTVRGGRAFANMAPGVAVRLGYRRDGRDRTARVVPEEPPARDVDAAAAELAQTARAQRDAARTLTRTYQRDAERAQQELARAQQELERNRDKELTEESRALVHQYLEQARRALENTQSPLLAMPAPPSAVAPQPPVAEPSPDAAPTAPEVAVGPTAPTPRGNGWTVSTPGGLRYSGRLGSTVIEARRPGGVNVIETGDSQVVLTGGDLSVRLSLVPGVGPRTRVASGAAGWSTAHSSAGDVARGIQGYLVNPRLGRALGASEGVLVLDVLSGSHADSLGVLPGDVLVSLDDHPVRALTSDALLVARVPRGSGREPTAQTAVVVRSHARRLLTLPGARRRPAATTAPRPGAVPPPRRTP